MRPGKQTETGQQVDLSSIQRLLLIQVDNKIGDMLVATSLFSPLHQRYPRLEIDVLATPLTAALLEGHPAVAQLHVYNKRDYASIAGLIWNLRRRQHDLTLNLGSYPSSTALWLTRLSGACHHLGFNKAGIWPYSISLPDHFHNDHVTQKHRSLLQRLGADSDICYDLPLPEKCQSNIAGQWLTETGQKRVLVNFFGSCPSKTLSVDKAAWLLKEIARILPTASIGISVPPGAAGVVEKIRREAGIGIPLGPQSHLLDFAAMIAQADLVVTPDTSVVHLAAAFNKPQLALYSDPVAIVQWGPNSSFAKSIFCPNSFSALPEAEIEATLQRFSEYGVVCD